MPKRAGRHPLHDVRGVPSALTAETDIVGIGGTVTPASLLAGYAMGIFPMAIEIAERGSAIGWYAPAERAVLRPPGMHISRSLRRSLKHFDITYDTAFGDVVAGCADPSREHGWITLEYRVAYERLHRAGHAHSVEVWQARELVGGLIGIELGGLFCADSKFRRVTDASKAAVAGLSRLMFAGEAGQHRMIDAQWMTGHLASLGFQTIPRENYARLVPELLAVPGAFGGGMSTR